MITKNSAALNLLSEVIDIDSHCYINKNVPKILFIVHIIRFQKDTKKWGG